MKIAILISLLVSSFAQAASQKITNAQIASNAAIAHSKMAANTASRVLCSNASGFTVACAMASSYLDATSSIQTQIDGKQPLDADLTSLAGASSTDVLYYRSAAGTWTPVTIGGNMTFSGGTLNSSGGGGGGTWGSITGTLSDQTDLNTALGLKAPLASPSFSGTVTLPTGLTGIVRATSGVVSAAALAEADLPAPTATTISASAIDWSTQLKKGGVYTKTLGANTTFTFSNLAVGTINVILTNTASNYTVTWPTVIWPNGAGAPTMSTGATSDFYTFVYDGTNVRGFYSQGASKEIFPKHYAARISNNGTPTISAQKPAGWITSLTNGGTGITNVFISGFTSAPSCICTAEQATGADAYCVLDGTITSSLLALKTRDDTGTNKNVNFDLHCTSMD
jgi:DNA-binding transcriptional regulator YdaS (Cro superfamily)